MSRVRSTRTSTPSGEISHSIHDSPRGSNPGEVGLVQGVDSLRDAFMRFRLSAVVTVRELRSAAESSQSNARLKELSAHASRSVRQAVAGNQASDDSTLAVLLDDVNDIVRSVVAANARARPGLQTQLADSPDPSVRAILAHASAADITQSLPYRIQRTLAADVAVEVRLRIAETTNYIDLFVALLADEHPKVRGACATNPRVTREQMETIITDRQWLTRAIAVTWGRRYPDDEQLLRLASDRSVHVRWEVLLRSDRPQAAVDLLADDADENIRHRARAMLAGDPHLADPLELLEPSRREPARPAPAFEEPAPDY